MDTNVGVGQRSRRHSHKLKLEFFDGLLVGLKELSRVLVEGNEPHITEIFGGIPLKLKYREKILHLETDLVTLTYTIESLYITLKLWMDLRRNIVDPR